MAETTSVYYRGGSADGVFIEATPEVFHTHPQRELGGADPDARNELYRNEGAQDVTVTLVGDDGQPVQQRVRAWVFVFESAAAAPRLDDEMNPLPATAP